MRRAEAHAVPRSQLRHGVDVVVHDASDDRVAAGRRVVGEEHQGQAGRRLLAAGADPVALLHVLDSLVATPVASLGEVRVPTLVLMGADDERAASAGRLTASLPCGTPAVVPGDHGTAAATPEFAAAIVDFLGGGR